MANYLTTVASSCLSSAFGVEEQAARTVVELVASVAFVAFVASAFN